MSFEQFYNAIEHAVFWRAMPPGALLFYSFNQDSYEIRIKPEGQPSTKLLRSIPRSAIIGWRDPLLTLNHAARHALKVAGLPVEVRVK